jgi:hypothetical protein
MNAWNRLIGKWTHVETKERVVNEKINALNNEWAKNVTFNVPYNEQVKKQWICKTINE